MIKSINRFYSIILAYISSIKKSLIRFLKTCSHISKKKYKEKIYSLHCHIIFLYRKNLNIIKININLNNSIIIDNS